jgi:pyruvate-formate lyase
MSETIPGQAPWGEPPVPGGRIARLRQQCLERKRERALQWVDLAGCGEESLVGHARDFAALLEASAPLIQPDELLVGYALAIPRDPRRLDLGFYDRHYAPGHRLILRLGLAGLRDAARARLAADSGPEQRDFLQAVAIAYDAACQYVARFAQHSAALAAAETRPARRAELERIAAVCGELAVAPPSSFHAALQLFQFTRVFGGHGTMGRLDQWLWPFLRGDLQDGRLSQAEAQELLECLFVKLNEFAEVQPDSPGSPARGEDGGAPPPAQDWAQAWDKPGNHLLNDSLRNITLAGQTPDGEDACNTLTYMCLGASARLMLPEPKLNVRFARQTPRRLLDDCCRLLARGGNLLAFYNDDVALPALCRLGIPLAEARDYCSDGCAELILDGRSTIRFAVYDALTALHETVQSAAERPYPAFADVLDDFELRLQATMPAGPAGEQSITFPFFAASIEDCLQLASPSGARYQIRGVILSEVGNAADGLAAIRTLLYDERSLSWGELLAALQANYRGHEPLRQLLLNRAPKYGNDDERADGLVREIAEFFCDGVHARAGNTPGRGGKWAAGFHSFGIHHRSALPASPDGRRQGDPTANSFSPAVGMDRHGPTAVLRSAGKVDLRKASHGSVLDLALHGSVLSGEEGPGKLAALVEAFLRWPSTATLQLNVIERETLLRARANPAAPEFRSLLVRVWGFSAVFVELPPALQDHVLARTEHVL